MKPSALFLSVEARYRWSVASRVLAATLGGYAVTALATAVLALLLPRIAGMARVDAVLAATLSNFAIYAGVAMAAFSLRSAARVWVVLVAIIALLGALLPMLMPGRGA